MTTMEIEGLALVREKDGELRVRDVDLAARAGLSRPRDVRKLIAEHREELEENGPLMPRARRARGRNQHGETSAEQVVEEFWLNEAQAYNLVALMAKAPMARKLRPLMARVFTAARRQAEANAQGSAPFFRRLINAILLPKPSEEWELMFPNTLVHELCRLDEHPWDGGPHPRHLASTNRKIYDKIFSTWVGRELKKINPNPHQGSAHHQHLTPEARDHLRTQLGIVETIARQSFSKADFWNRMDREYGGGMLQVPFPGFSP